MDRPATWEDVVFKCVPLQEGEEDSPEVRTVCWKWIFPILPPYDGVQWNTHDFDFTIHVAHCFLVLRILCVITTSCVYCTHFLNM